MLIISMLVGLIVGAAAGFFVFTLINKSKSIPKADFDALNVKHITASSDLAAAQNRIQDLLIDLKNLDVKLNAKDAEFEVSRQNLFDKHAEQSRKLNEGINTLTGENSSLLASNNSLKEKLADHKQEILELQKTAQLQFEKIATQILEEKSGKFTETNKINIEALLKPLGENLENFKKKVEEVYSNEARERFSLAQRVKELVDQTNKVSLEANNLATALKGQSKTQGDWGEMILESILQRSGLVKDREYYLQQSFKDEEGKNLRPDVLVHLPDNRVIIIDAKVSLVAHDKYTHAVTQEEQTLRLAEMMKSIKSHIDSLSEKKYDNLETSLDFTMMFVPIEPAYLIAIQHDQDLWAYAYKKRILLISPTNLIACLKLIADLWKREMQSKNAMKIVERGEKLYDKFVSFAQSLEEVGKHIDKTKLSYDTAISQLNTGRGNLVRQAELLKSLGLKSNKAIPEILMSPIDDIDDSNENPNQVETPKGSEGEDGKHEKNGQ